MASHESGDAGELGLVVVNFGSASMIESNLSEVLARYPSVVVDNFTTQDERDRLGALCATTKSELHVLDRNTGFGFAANEGARRLLDRGCERLLLLNPDLRIGAEEIAGLLVASRDDSEAIVAPRILNDHGQTWFKGGALDSRQVVASHVDPDGPDVPSDWLTGACLLVPAPVWRSLGGFDPDYFLYWEDVDLTNRWRRRGGTLRVVTDVTAVHSVGGTQGGGGKSLGYSYYNARNRMLFAGKRLGIAGLLRALRTAPSYRAELLKRSGAGDAGARDDHARAIRRGTRNGAIRGLRATLSRSR